MLIIRLKPSLIPLLFCLSCGLLACGDLADDAPINRVFNPCETLTIVTPEELSGAQSSSLDQAIALWNERAPLKLTRAAAADAPSIPVFFRQGAAFVHGYYNDSAGSITINQQLNERPAAITLAHELGHAFGLHHVDPKTRASVMNPANLSTKPTAEDAALVGELWPECQPTSAQPG